MLAADAQRAAELLLQVGRGREMVGVDVGLQHPFDLEAMLAHESDHPIGGMAVGAARGRVIVQHRVDQGALAGGRVDRDVAHRVGGRVEEARDLGPAGDGRHRRA